MDGLRTLTPGDVNQALELSGAEGWNQTETDWKLLVQPPGNVCLAFEAAERIIATATAMNYNNQLAWIGMVLVHREYRGKGLSKLLLTELLTRLSSVKSIKLDATPAGEPVYQKFGFKKEYLIHRMVTEKLSPQLTREKIRFLPDEMTFTAVPEMIQYDQNISGTDRKSLLEHLVKNYPKEAWMLKNRGKISGYALGRPGKHYMQVGPVMADSLNDARDLLLHFFHKHKENRIVVDVLGDKKELLDWLQRMGFVNQRYFIRMFLNDSNVAGNPEKQFLISGPEFG